MCIECRNPKNLSAQLVERRSRVLRSKLHGLGLRYVKDLVVSVAPGFSVVPSIVFRRERVAIFLDSCFWHGCPKPNHCVLPKGNEPYWGSWVNAIKKDDARADVALIRAGWKSVRVWTHEDPIEALKRIVPIVTERMTKVRSGRKAS